MTARIWAQAIAASLCAFAATGLLAQPTPSPAPAPPGAKSVRISFLPPPIEGAFSLGIYDRAGKLVRVLHREADLDQFEIGNDSLSTTWDGKNDAGESMPAGKYHARGYVVGDVEVEGVGYFFNDWVTSDESPRVTKITAITVEDDQLAATGVLSSGGNVTVVCDSAGNVKSTRNESIDERPSEGPAGFAGVTDLVHCTHGKDNTLWVVDRTEKGSEVKQFSAAKELLRRLAISPDDPQPQRIAASTKDDRVYLLEENDATQRVRALTLVGTTSDAGQAVSDWKVEFEKKIVAHADFRIDDGKPVVSRGSDAGDAIEKVKIRLVPNPLQADKAAEVELIAGFDSKGAVLKTADGLPLQTISETAGLKRVVLAKSGEKSLDLFQDDGAVVEQFRVGNLDQMMSFDCGEFELK